jgi:predicted enzyme related to lactoylglutathione lyase
MTTSAPLVTGIDFVPFSTQNLDKAMGIGHNVNRTATALHVDDVAAARSVLEQRGVQFDGETLDTGVCVMAFFADPDGNALMLHHRYAPRVTES